MFLLMHQINWTKKILNFLWKLRNINNKVIKCEKCEQYSIDNFINNSFKRILQCTCCKYWVKEFTSNFVDIKYAYLYIYSFHWLLIFEKKLNYWSKTKELFSFQQMFVLKNPLQFPLHLFKFICHTFFKNP